MTIHDHCDGSAHCMECAGPCKLEGAERVLTNIVRAFAVARNRSRGREPTWFVVEKILRAFDGACGEGVPADDLRRIVAAELTTDSERGPRLDQS